MDHTLLVGVIEGFGSVDAKLGHKAIVVAAGGNRGQGSGVRGQGGVCGAGGGLGRG